MTEYEITKEAIARGPGRKMRYPFATLEVGDCFYERRDEEGNLHYDGVYTARRYWEGKLPGRKFDLHVVSVGLRVQRVE